MKVGAKNPGTGNPAAGGRRTGSAGGGAGTDTRDRLIRAGRKLISRKGFEGASVRALTEEAGANLGAVTYHFESKEKLYQAILEDVLGPIREHLEMLKSMPFSAPQRLEFFIRGMFQHLQENPDMPRLMVQEIVLGEDPSPQILKTVRVVVSVLTGIIQEGQAVGTIRQGDSVLMALSTLSQPIYLSIMPPILANEEMKKAGVPQPRISPEDHAVDFVMNSLLAQEEEDQ